MLVKEALEVFWERNELGQLGRTNENFNQFKLGKLHFRLPNLNKEGYLLHDINHLLSGYGIDWLSEFEIAAWEIASGGRKGYGLSWVYPITGTILGLVVIPRRTLSAFRNGKCRFNAHILNKGNNLFELPINQLQAMSKRK